MPKSVESLHPPTCVLADTPAKFWNCILAFLQSNDNQITLLLNGEVAKKYAATGKGEESTQDNRIANKVYEVLSNVRYSKTRCGIDSGDLRIHVRRWHMLGQGGSFTVRIIKNRQILK